MNTIQHLLAVESGVVLLELEQKVQDLSPRRSLGGKKKVFRCTAFTKKPAGTPCVGGGRWAVGGWRLAVGGGWWWLVAVGGWGLVIDGGWQWLAVGGWSPLAVGGGWQAVVGGGWQLVAVGG